MTAIANPRHRVALATARLHAELDDVVDAPVWSMDPAETGATLVALDRAVARVEELRARVAAHADRVGVGDEVAASSTAAWFAHATKQTHATAEKTVALGQALDDHSLTRDALAAGDLVVDQARPIIKAVDALPDDLDQEVVQRAEAHLVNLAGQHHARELARLGRGSWRWWLRRPPTPTRPGCWSVRRPGPRPRPGSAATTTATAPPTGSSRSPPPSPATLTKVLWALAAPKHVHATGGAGVDVHERPTPERLGEALCEFITRYPTKKLPKTGALNATVVVTIGLDPLTGALRETGVLDTGQKISAAMARRLACQAGILPAVLDGDSVPLDLGRRKRLHSDYQRTAMLLRDRGCAAEGCDRTWGLHAHHIEAWSTGGNTSVENGVTPLRLAPPPRPRHPLRHHLPAHRDGRLPPADVTVKNGTCPTKQLLGSLGP